MNVDFDDFLMTAEGGFGGGGVPDNVTKNTDNFVLCLPSFLTFGKVNAGPPQTDIFGPPPNFQRGTPKTDIFARWLFLTFGKVNCH